MKCMRAGLPVACAVLVIALISTGCVRGAQQSVHPVAPATPASAPRVMTSAASLPVIMSAALEMVTRDGAKLTVTNDPAAVDASAAVRAAIRHGSVDASAVVVLVKVRFTDASVHDRLAYLVVAQPVVIRLHGPSTRPSSVGREVFAVDASTGAVFETFAGNL
jgi:hypothetical protein